MRYTIGYSQEAAASLRAQVRYIAVDQQAPDNAAGWLGRVMAAVRSLEVLPTRYGVDAEQTAAMGFEVRRLVFEQTYLIFYTIDDAQQRVTVVTFRHGAQSGRGGP